MHQCTRQSRRKPKPACTPTRTASAQTASYWLEIRHQFKVNFIYLRQVWAEAFYSEDSVVQRKIRLEKVCTVISEGIWGEAGFIHFYVQRVCEKVIILMLKEGRTRKYLNTKEKYKFSYQQYRTVMYIHRFLIK